MRTTLRLALTGLTVGIFACDAQSLTSPDVPPRRLLPASSGHVGHDLVNTVVNGIPIVQARRVFLVGRLSHRPALDPLVFLDGQRLHIATLGQIPPASIASIEVIKVPAAVRLYGEEARAGVIHIHTKTGATAPRS